jgi:peptidyl-prolyl cis-trans isomerase SurA
MQGSVRWVIAAGVALGLVGVSTARAEDAGRGSYELIDAVVASVDGSPITLIDLDKYERGAGQLLSQEEKASRSAMLDAMIRNKMFQAEFDKKGIKASDSDVNIYIDNIVEESHSSREQIKKSLAQMGVSWDDYFERMRQELQRMALINREIRSRVNVTPEEVERAWREDPRYGTPEKLEIGDIYIPVSGSSQEAQDAARAKANEAYQAARKNFSKAAKKFSAGPNAADGGILGTFSRGEMAAKFAKAIEGLDPGDVSTPFEADGAFHIVTVVRVVKPGRLPFDQVRKDIEDQLYSQSLETRFRRWVDEDLRKRHTVTVQLDDLDKLEPSRS